MADTRNRSRRTHRAGADVGRLREHRRRVRLFRLVLLVAAVAGYLTFRVLTGHPLGLPRLPTVDPLYLISGLFFLALLGSLVGTTVAAGRSPHVLYRPEQIPVRLSDVKGMPAVVDEVQRSLDLFLAAETFRTRMGGSPRRGLLFEGAPGTGKTMMAKALAAEAGVPFLFVSATGFQSMYHGATARKIRSYFAALRRAARAEGGAIGFIEEIDAIATVRGGLSAASGPTGVERICCGPLPGLGIGTALPAGGQAPATVLHRSSVVSEGIGGVVNELLIQLQSFDTPTGWQRVRSYLIDRVNLFLPAHRQLRRPQVQPVDVLIIAATNRADNLDPALLRPGRFDRRLVFELPEKAGRREIIDHYLSRKAHTAELDGDEHRDALAGVTQGYSPVMIERLLDEALVNAVRRQAPAMTWRDIEQARLVTEVGLGQPIAYTPHEASLISTHEAGHAVTAWLVAPERRLEILTIVKRGGALGLLAHGDAEDVYTRSSRELDALIRISLGGLVAEELFFGDTSTGTAADLAYATTLATQMVGQSGMSDTLVSFAAVRGSALSGGNLVSTVLADGEARQLVERLLQARRDEVRRMLDGNRHLVEALRDALLERHELIGHEITDVLIDADARHRGAGGHTRPEAAVPDRSERVSDHRLAGRAAALTSNRAVDLRDPVLRRRGETRA
jgi:cell division protease FtsH